MAEIAGRQLTARPSSVAETPPSIADVKREIRETRVHLAVAIARTSERLDSLLKGSQVGQLPVLRDSGALGIVVGTLQAFARARGVWTRAKAAGIVRVAAGVAAMAAMAFTVVHARRRRRPRLLEAADVIRA